MNSLRFSSPTIFAPALILTVLTTLAPAAQAAPPLESYVVVLERQAGSSSRIAAEVASRNGGKVGYIYSKAFSGFSISLPATAANRLKNDRRFKVFTPDITMSAIDLPEGHQQIGVDKITYGSGEALVNHLDDVRVATKVAVLDTGIDHTHMLLNVVESVDCMVKTTKGPAWSASYTCESGAGRGMDGNGHGTHVAGTIGALDKIVSTDTASYHLPGVATGVGLVAVKVLNDQGSGYLSTILAGLEWVASNGTVSVVNMSLGGKSTTSGALTAYQEAIDPLVARGIQVVVAAGNENAVLDLNDGDYYVPAEVESAITVAALTENGSSRASFSNHGDVVDIYAPGSSILSTYPGNTLAYLDGTSMAAPHVAGAIALLTAANSCPVSGCTAEIATEILVDGKPTLSVEGINTTAIEYTGGGGDTSGTGGDGGGSTSPTKGRGKKK